MKISKMFGLMERNKIQLPKTTYAVRKLTEHCKTLKLETPQVIKVHVILAAESWPGAPGKWRHTLDTTVFSTWNCK